MKVVIDISQIAHPGGVANYTQHLAEELLKIPELDLTFFYSSLRKPYQGDLSNVKSFRYPPTVLEILFNKLRLSIDSFITPGDIFHSTDWMQPRTRAKKITTFHDLIPIKFPEWSDPKVVTVHKRRLKIVENEIDKVIAVSKSTKKDLLEVSKIPEEKIVVIYEAADEAFKVKEEKETGNFKSKYNLPSKFLLAIGGVGKRRNLENIKKAAASIPLIITGENIPFLSNKEIPLLYNAASVLVYASLYEGFGLPILEAMQSGTPVVTSNLSSMAEIAEDNAVLVDPQDISSIEKGIELALFEKEYYRKKGLAHSKKFSWKKCAQETVEVYQKLHESP